MATKKECAAMLSRIGDDEPIFILRAQDQLAPEVIMEWAFRALSADVDVKKIAEARECARAMELWQQDNDAKVPD